MCIQCHQRDGITQAREEMKKKKKPAAGQPNKPAGTQHISLKDHVGNLNSNSTTTTDPSYNYVPTLHQGQTFTVVADPVFVDPNSTKSVALAARQIGLENGILNYGGQDRTWTFLCWCCDARPHTLLQQFINEATECLICGKRFLKNVAYKKHQSETRGESGERSKPEFYCFFFFFEDWWWPL